MGRKCHYDADAVVRLLREGRTPLEIRSSMPFITPAAISYLREKAGIKPFPRGPKKGLIPSKIVKAKAALEMKRAGLTYRQIADFMRVSPQVVMYWIHRILEAPDAKDQCSNCGRERTGLIRFHRHFPEYTIGRSVTLCPGCHTKAHSSQPRAKRIASIRPIKPKIKLKIFTVRIAQSDWDEFTRLVKMTLPAGTKMPGDNSLVCMALAAFKTELMLSL